MERQSVYSQAGVLSQNGGLEGKEERREGGGKEERRREREEGRGEEERERGGGKGEGEEGGEVRGEEGGENKEERKIEGGWRKYNKEVGERMRVGKEEREQERSRKDRA